MSTQNEFDYLAIEQLPIVMSVIQKTKNSFNRNQIVCLVSKSITNSITPIADMSEVQLRLFQKELLRRFDESGWM